MMPGGVSDIKPVNADITTVAESVKPQAEKKTGLTFSSYQVINYRTQMVAGLVYFIKVKADDQYYILKVYQPLPYEKKDNELLDIRTATADEETGSF